MINLVIYCITEYSVLRNKLLLEKKNADWSILYVYRNSSLVKSSKKSKKELGLEIDVGT